MNATNSPPRQPPLAGLTVVDLSRVLAGPWCTMSLADLGAEVLKVEQPKVGDDTRAWGPPFAAGESAYYLCANRNKKSLAIDISRTEGQDIVRRLCGEAHIFVENFRSGALARFGLDYATLAARNPRLIYCSISGYGRVSPLADLPGYDFVVQAEGGLMAITGEPDGAPMKVGVAIADLFTGMNATQAILAAVIAMQRDGRGQHLDLALFDSQLAMLANVGSAYLVSGKEPARYGNAHATVVPYQVFGTARGDVVVAVGNDRQFQLLCEKVLQQPQIAQDRRFATNSGRVTHREELLAALDPLFATETAEVWLPRLVEAGIPAGRVRKVGEALESTEAAGRAMVRTVAHPSAGQVRLVASPLRLAETPVVDPVAPPLLGQHTDEVLRDKLAMSADEVAGLRRSGVIA